MYKMYKLGGRNTSQIWLLITVCSKQAAEVLTEIGLEVTWNEERCWK